MDKIFRNTSKLTATDWLIDAVIAAVQNGADAVAYLRRAASKGNAYDLCFVNWYMQGGEPFIRSVRENFPKGSLTICCSTNEKELVECQMLAAGVDCVVERPI